MGHAFRWAVAVVSVAGVIGVGAQPANAQGVVAVATSGGAMSDQIGPSLGQTVTTGTMAGTGVILAGPLVCNLDGETYGYESVISANGVGWFHCNGYYCEFGYQRVGVMAAMSGYCPWSGAQLNLVGTIEPNSALPTTSLLFQLAGQIGLLPAAIQGNIAISPPLNPGLSLGQPLPGKNVEMVWWGTMAGVFGGVVGTCAFDFEGFGYESVATGNAYFQGECRGGGIFEDCTLQWQHVGPRTAVTGFCYGTATGNVTGMGELVFDGSSFDFVGELTIL